MTKKFFLFAVAALTLALASCSKPIDDGGYSKVYPGAIIYNDVRLTSALATDGVSIAMRLAILMEEMEAAGLTLEVGGDEPNWSKLGSFTFAFSNTRCNKKEFLFGNSKYATISRLNDNEYRIEYGYDDVHAYYAYCYDLNIRRGAYIVDTNGVTLDMTDNATPWTVRYADDSVGSVDGSMMTFMLNLKQSSDPIDRDSDDADVVSNVGNTTIYYDANTEEYQFDCSFSGCSTKLTTGMEYPWSAMGTVKISNFTDFMIENTIDRKFSFEVESYGEQFTFNASEISYKTDSPLIYDPSEYLHAPVGGIETAEYHNYTNTTVFPSATVTVTTLPDGRKVFQYNGERFEEK